MTGTHIERPRCQCALGGALITINAMKGAAALVPASPGWAARADASASQGAGYWGTTANNGRATPSTNLHEREIVFGGEERLREQISTTREVVDAELFAVLTGCMTDIIGDDVKAVVAEGRNGRKDLVVAETGGFRGTTFDGYDLIWKALVEQYVEPAAQKEPALVNILGVVPTQDVFWRGNLLELKRLLEAIGVSANTFVTPFDELPALRGAGKASLNIVLSDTNGIKVAQRFEEAHGTPWFNTALPIGPTATTEFLRDIGRRLGLDQDRIERVIEAESKYYYAFVEPFADLYNDQDFQRNVVIVGTASGAYALTRFAADDLNWLPFATAITDSLDEAQIEKVKARFEQLRPETRPHVVFETDTSRIQERVLKLASELGDPYGEPLSPAFVLGSTLDRPLAAAIKGGFLSVSYPVVNRVVTDQGYSGYRGGLRLITDILSVLVSNR